MSILEVWQRLYTLRYVPVTLFKAVFSAGTVFLLFHRQSNRSASAAHSRTTSNPGSSASSPSAISLDRAPSKNGAGSSYIVNVELCIRYLNEVSRSWKSARNIAAILAKLLEEQVGPAPPSTSTATSPALEVRYSPPPGPPPGYVDAFLNGGVMDVQMDTMGQDMSSFEQELWGVLYPEEQHPYLSGSPARSALLYEGGNGSFDDLGSIYSPPVFEGYPRFSSSV